MAALAALREHDAALCRHLADCVSDVAPQLRQRLRQLYSRIHVIISPPRCSSTAFARVLWEHPSVGYYAHEPFEATYYAGEGLADVVTRLESPLDLRDLKAVEPQARGSALLIKDMPYQIGDFFPLVRAIADPPLIFLMRDPRLSIASRMRKKIEVGDSPFFPFVECGFELHSRFIAACEAHEIPHVIVDSSDFRNHPTSVFGQVLHSLGLSFAGSMLDWASAEHVDIDNLGGKHSHLYREVLSSTRLKPETAPAPPLDSFPTASGLREAVRGCVEIYHRLKESDRRIVPR